MTRATTTLIAAALAGLLLWLAGDVFDDGAVFGEDATGRYWAVVGLLAAAGLVMALSQLLGGWTKWGVPRISRAVFLVGFLPALVAGLWVLFYVDPGDHWLADKVEDWSDDLGLVTLVESVGLMFAAVAFGLGLLLGFTFDTTGPRTVVAEPEVAEKRRPPEDSVVGAGAQPAEPVEPAPRRPPE